MGSLKRENSCTKLQPTSPNESISESKKTTTTTSSDLEQNSLTPSSLCLPPIKFEVEADVEGQSPDNSLWESLFSDHFDTDFMILSPVRNLPSPQGANYNYNYVHGQSPVGCSPPRSSTQLLGAYSSMHHSAKEKGSSPLNRVLNSPNNHYMQMESLSLPALDNFLEDYQRGDDVIACSTITTSGTLGNLSSSSSEHFDDALITASHELLECLTAPPEHSGRSTSDTSVSGSAQSEQESGIYKMESAPLSHQLQQERQHEKQHQKQRGGRPPLPQQHTPESVNRSVMGPPSVGPEQEQDSGLELVHHLLACAEAVAKDDYMLARRYLHHLNRVVTPLGDSMQRVASCFTEALSARLAATLTAKPCTSALKPFTPFPSNSLEILKIYQIIYQACPYIKFAHFTANQAIFEAFEAEERVHVIDLDILQGYQWPSFMQALAARPGGAPFLRLTGVGASQECVRETGRCLTELAHSLRVPFEFHPVGEELEDLKPHMFNRRVGEALAVNGISCLCRLSGNSLGNLLAMIRDQAPNIVTIVEQEANHNGPYFLGRFLEALHYYSAIFDSLDATFPPDSSQRAKVEQYIFAPEIRNIVACEGQDRVVRHERLEKWRKVVESKGFEGVALSANAVTQSNILLNLYSCDGYRLTEDNGCLLLGWQDRPLLAASAWRC